jgi:hypothetical protein
MKNENVPILKGIQPPIWRVRKSFTLLEMFESDGENIFQFCSILATLREPILFEKEMSREYFEDIFGLCVHGCSRLRLTHSLKLATRLMNRLSDESYSISRKEIDELESRIHDEMEDLMFLSLDVFETHLYTEEYPFGEQIVKLIPEIEYDIREAAQCLASGRGTACVLHLQRVVDTTFNELGSPLGVNATTNPSWDGFFEKLQKALRAKYTPNAPSRDDEWKKHNAFYADILPQLYAIKDAWRNPTMHAAKKYSVNDALAVFRIMQLLVKKLATNMPITL